MSTTNWEERTLLFTAKPGLKNGFIAAVIFVIAIGAFAFAIGLLLEDTSHWGAAIIVAAVGVLLAAWAVYEAEDFRYVRLYYTDHAERVRGTTVIEQIDFSKKFKFSYAFRANGSEHLLSIDGPKKAEFTILTMRRPGQRPTRSEPSVDQVESLRDCLVDHIAEQIGRSLAAGKPFVVDPRWMITQDGIEIEGQRISWDELQLHPNNDTGELVFYKKTLHVAARSMMADNVLGALHFLYLRVRTSESAG